MFKKGKSSIVIVSVCLILVTSVLPFVRTYEPARLSRLFSYVQNYRQTEYAQILESAGQGRLVVPIEKGYLLEGDSLVTFGWCHNVETVNGAYNQGDPKFFKHTVHLEWEQRWFNYEHTRENLMQESAAKYIFIRHSEVLLADTKGLTCIVNNSYGQLWELNEGVARAVNVTPILLDVQEPEQVMEFFNILLPKGYRMVFVSIDSVGEDMKERFEYIMLDSESKIPQYEGKVVFLLNNTDQSSNLVTNEGEGIIKLNLPYITYTNKFFYRGDKGDVSAWADFEFDPSLRLDNEALVMLQQAGNEMGEYLYRLEYEPANYKLAENRIELEAEPGFTLVKDSYFPYWSAKEDTLLSTTQGFMLIYSDDTRTLLNYKKPAINTVATMVSIIGLAAAAIVLAIGAFKSGSKKSKTR